MYSSQTGTAASANVCENCGKVTVLYPNTHEDKKKGLAFAIFGWLFAAISFLFIPIVFGALALFLGFMTYHDRSKVHGAILMGFSAIGLILGSLFSLVVAGTMFI